MRGLLQVLLLIVVLLSLSTVQAHLNKYSPQVGAWGDSASIGNMGAQVEIRTHIYEAKPPDLDYFWVGDNLQNGAFIQFGYSFEPGNMCLRGEGIGQSFDCSGGSDMLGSADGRWEWQYWPNATGSVFYLGRGTANSAGPDGSWHNYSIVPNSEGDWSFHLDGKQVASIPFAWTNSIKAAYLVAEKSTDNIDFGQLGPVEFQNLSYLTPDCWHSVTSLTAIVGHAVNTENVTNPYGVQLLGPNHVVAGSNIAQPSPEQLLWAEGQSNAVPLGVAVIIAVSVIAFAILAIVVIRRRKHYSRTGN